MKKLLRLSLLCATFMGVPARAQMQDTSTSPKDTLHYGSVEGVVMDAGMKEPIPGAIVFVQGSKRGVNSDANGHYRIDSVLVGKCYIEARMMGYYYDTLKVRIDNNSTTRCNLKLKLCAHCPICSGKRPRKMTPPDRTESIHWWNEREINKLPGH